MPSRCNNEGQQVEKSGHGTPSPTTYAQPWWQRGIGMNSISSSEENALHLQNNGDNGINSMSFSPKNGFSAGDGKEQNSKQAPASIPLAAGENIETNSQMELVGHSIVLTSYPFPDPCYGGILTYGAPQVRPPHLVGMHQTRMALPLEMEEEPVYVNAKQYHGILRRRQVRAKLESEKKLIKVRKPYLHESRHQHAMRRARGCGGRFLNSSKKNGNANSEKDANGGPNENSNKPIGHSNGCGVWNNGSTPQESSSYKPMR